MFLDSAFAPFKPKGVYDNFVVGIKSMLLDQMYSYSAIIQHCHCGVSGPLEGGEANSLEKDNSYWDCFLAGLSQ